MSRRKRLEAACSKIQEGLSELENLKDEYQDWRDNLPENLDQSPTAEKLDEVIDLLDTVIGNGMDIDFLEGADLPLGFGRD